VCYRDIKRQWSITHTGTHPNCQRPVRQWIPLSIFFFRIEEEEEKKLSVCARNGRKAARNTEEEHSRARIEGNLKATGCISGWNASFFSILNEKGGKFFFWAQTPTCSASTAGDCDVSPSPCDRDFCVSLSCHRALRLPLGPISVERTGFSDFKIVRSAHKVPN
jgi:hypothetical protein